MSTCNRFELFVLACFALLASGCKTVQTYDGPRRPPTEVAHISGDLRLNMGLPITVSLRKVDGTTLSANENAVDVLPGTHTLLVDCRVQETGSVTRHEIEVEVFEGQAYKLVPDTAPGLRGCSDVRLEAAE